MIYLLLTQSLAMSIGEFECIDDTKFKLFTSTNDFVINSCPPGLCATRTPKFKNPCIGRDRATEIDGVVPPVPIGSGGGTLLSYYRSKLCWSESRSSSWTS
jgi:hypothetical protein